jgi:hypothetical protein
MAAKQLAAAAALAWIALASPPEAAAQPDVHTQEQLCQNAAYRNMHENECLVRGHGGLPGSGSDDGGLLGIIGRIVGGIL